MATERIVKGALPRIEWSPVITGVLCALAIHIVLGLFGTAFGLAAEPGDSKAIGVGAGIWALLVPFIASAIGAFVCVRIARREDSAGAHLHGALVWAIGLILGALFITGTMATSAMTSATASAGNVRGGLSARDATGPLAEVRMDDAAKGAAAAAGAGALGALLGLAGAFLGAAAGRRALTGQGFDLGFTVQRRRARRMDEDREIEERRYREREERHGTVQQPTAADGGSIVGTHAEVRRSEVVRPGEDPTVHH